MKSSWIGFVVISALGSACGMQVSTNEQAIHGGGACSPVGCDDGNPCTTDRCLPSNKCSHIPDNGAACVTSGRPGMCRAGSCQRGVVATSHDLNGDGHADLVIGAYHSASSTGRVEVHIGTTVTSIPGPDGVGGFFGASFSTNGDINGDGVSDLVVSAYGKDAVYLYLGGLSGLATTPTSTVTGPDGTGFDFGYPVVTGDFNADGFSDVVAGAFRANAGAGRVYVYRGSSVGLSSSPVSLSSSPGGFGRALAVGDLNGDGYDDLAVGGFSPSTGSGGLAWFLGGPSGLSTAGTVISGTGSFGNEVALGDLNGDGYADLVVGSVGAGSWSSGLVLFRGSVAGLSPWTTIPSPDPMISGFGQSLAIEDGRLAVGAYSPGGVGYLHLYTNIASAPVTITSPDGSSTYFGSSVVGSGDLNGDGTTDFVAGAIGAHAQDGAAYTFSGVDLTRFASFYGVAGSAERFGIWED